MVIAIGTDLVHIPRIGAAIARHGVRFARRLLSTNELREYTALKRGHDAFLARRFAAREACAKALGRGIQDGISWRDFEVHHDTKGAPRLRLCARAEACANSMGVARTHLSLSDEGEYAMAFVVLTAKA
jgi:holo-[acyl-carrier protein] synthase